MHGHLRDLGREMADQLNNPRRLWRTVYCKPLISKGIKSIFTQTKAALLWLEVNFYDHIVTNIPPWIRLQNLQTLSIIGGGLKILWQNNVQVPFQLKELRIYNQTELKELNLGFLRCLEEITIHGCENLKHVFGISDLRKLVELNIAICSELEEINFVRPICLEKIRIRNCRRLITLGGMSNLRKLVELSINLFVEIGIDNTCNHLGRYMVSAIIFCAVIVVKTSTATNMINEVICEYDINPWLKFEVRQGEWMITSVITKEDEINSYIVNKGYCFPFDYLCFPEDVMVKRVTMPVMKGEEQKILNVLRTIVDKLHQN
ncbi:hypothetical protein SUGI_0676060 [Cryptomeria japonica]|nr:hypothetical protein SUGI_0676060 [Cryptomeria japonica]